MRSVVVYLKNTEKPAVEAVVSSFAKHFPGEKWIYPVTGDPTLWIRFYDEYQSELEPEEMPDLVKALGQVPDVALIADVSGRIKGEKEARMFVEQLLTVFPGVAQDDYGDHYWSLEEINAGSMPQGLHFFDTQGWYDREMKGRE
ncbi:MAG: hypothetical protein K0Q55_332 [Verrucomicrobia bacterium]|jgi:hypothetical protein|nr:hypothetical protein [Verrucomicrobiota bacterium]